MLSNGKQLLLVHEQLSMPHLDFKCMSALLLQLIALRCIYFFREEWEEKDFLERLGQKELRWIKKKLINSSILFLEHIKPLH